MLLRMEVTAFHPARLHGKAVRHTEMAVSVRPLGRPPDSLVSVALFLGFPQARGACDYPDGR